MLRVKCPWCGEREQVEFTCHGEAYIARPNNGAQLDDKAWGEYLYFKENAKGVVLERWQHSHGCRQWFMALRDNVSDEFLGFAKPTDPPLSIPKSYRQEQSRASIPMPRSSSGYGSKDKRKIVQKK